MARNKKKRTQHTLRAVVIAAAVLFLLNLIFARTLERYVKKELTERTVAATDGFYRLTLDDVSVNFFKGELRLEGVRLAPDMVVFRRWEAKDSLPPAYVDAHIPEIGVKGFTLNGNWNFRRVGFSSFDVKKPQIHLFDTFYSQRFRKKPHRGKTKTLYEQMAPYVDLLRVAKVNLDHVSVTYTVDNPVTPIIYELRDASFHGDGFLLDSASSSSGKLLYMDHFDLVTHVPQVLIANTGFCLTADSIRLSTRDSLVYVGQVKIVPQEALWEQTKRRPAASLGGSARQVVAKGIGFERKDNRNYLSARSLELSDTRVNAFQRVKTEEEKKGKRKGWNGNSSFDADSLLETLALYDVIAPVLDKVSVGRVGIGNARLDFRRQVGDSIETYRVAHFDFEGNDFLIDSLSMQQYELGYFRDIAFEADSIRADMSALNHRLEMGRMGLNTADGYFRMERISVAPRTYRGGEGYWEGSVDTVRVDGLRYDKGLGADLFRVSAPRITYRGTIGLGRKKKTRNTRNSSDPAYGLNPLFRYLAIGRIEVKEGTAMLHDREEKETYRLTNFNFFVKNFRLDSLTERAGSPFFRYGYIGCDFRNFDNPLPGTPYRLAIRNGRMSTEKGMFRLRQVDVRPRKTAGLSPDKDYVCASAPLVEIDGAGFPMTKGTGRIEIGRLRVEAPEVCFGPADSPAFRTKTERIELSGFAYDTAAFVLENAVVTRPSVTFLFADADTLTRLDSAAVAGINRSDTLPRSDRLEEEDVRVESDLYRTLGRVARRFRLGRLQVDDGVIGYGWRFANPVLTQENRSRINLAVENLTVDTDQRLLEWGHVRFRGDELEFPLNNGFYALKVKRFDWNDMRVESDSVHLVSPYPKELFAFYQPHHKDWFDVFAATVRLEGIDVPSFLSEGIFRADALKVGNILLQNYKNKQIPIRSHLVPMLYTVIQQAPFKFDIADAYVNDFFVIYEELGKKSTRPGKLVFTDMNGHVTGLTNIPSYREQYIKLEATGKMMGEGDFMATWRLPVDSLNDRFLLDAYLHGLDFTTLNQIITPLAPAKIKSGRAEHIIFHMDAGSAGGTIDLALPYRDLQIALLKKKDGETEEKAFLSGLANLILKHDNPDYPDREGSRLREVNMYVERDPYHSTFNYLWQLLKPAMIETVGISRTEQKVVKGVVGFFHKVKNFFRFGKKKKEEMPLPPTHSYIRIEEEEEEGTEIK